VGRKIQVVVPNSSSVSGSGGSATGYTHHRQITINGSVPSPQLNFPVLINIPFGDPAGAAASLKTSVTSGQGYDIMFAKNSDGSGQLNSEIEKYDSSSGALVAWVNIDSTNFPSGLTNGTQFYMFYGKSGVSSPPNSPSAVWDSNYKGVWHMNDSAANTTVKDSTSNGFNGTNAANTNTKSIAGKIGNSLSYNGSGDQTTIATSGSLSGSFTVEQWVYGGGTFIGSRRPYDASFDAKLQSGSSIHGDIGNGSGWINTSADASFTYTTSAWYDIVYTVSPTGYTIYANGAPVGSNTFSDTPLLYDANHILTIGNCANSCGEYFGGNIDEVRVSNIVRSADWIKTEYLNQLSPSNFYSLSGSQISTRPAAAPLLKSRGGLKFH
jgi:hypothetical protein